MAVRLTVSLRMFIRRPTGHLSMSQTLTPEALIALLPHICRISQHAGDAILQIYQQAATQQSELQLQQKADESPLTAADLAAHHVICHALSALTPSIPILSEEAADIPWPTRQHWPQYWLVDPLDGTKEFIKRNGEFTVNIALVIAGEPVLGVIHAPVWQKTYSAVVGYGAFVDAGQGPSAIHCQAPKAGEPVVVVGSKSHAQDGMDDFLQQYPLHQLHAVGSSLKFCLVAEGKAHVYPRFGPTMLWDTGAGHVIAKAAGAQVTYEGYAGPAYHREALRNGAFLVTSIPAG